MMKWAMGVWRVEEGGVLVCGDGAGVEVPQHVPLVQVTAAHLHGHIVHGTKSKALMSRLL